MTDLPADALRVVATLPIDPAKSAEAAAALSTLAAATLANEPGCYAYDVYESTAAPGTFVTVEAWRAQEDLDAHMATPHMGAAFEVLGGAIAGDVAIHPLKAL